MLSKEEEIINSFLKLEIKKNYDGTNEFLNKNKFFFKIKV